MFKKAIVTSTILLLSACTVSKKDANSVNYGDKPSNYSKALIGDIKRSLKDPDSIKVVSITNPYRAYSTYGFGSIQYGWYITVRYNAKNSYGGYVGETGVNYVYLNGKYDGGILGGNGNGDSMILDKITYICNGDCPSF
ncbi:hypothetical protein [Rosenbergiella epipactidis]|uniref:hypothetical protein n=1 Tax=Rosenbergiella epipactidis TaxID=1544694 RepID=UPI001F4F767D|nr:hypothetical protein [Rosenbergiella epipactidis]